LDFGRSAIEDKRLVEVIKTMPSPPRTAPPIPQPKAPVFPFGDYGRSVPLGWLKQPQHPTVAVTAHQGFRHSGTDDGAEDSSARHEVVAVARKDETRRTRPLILRQDRVVIESALIVEENSPDVNLVVDQPQFGGLRRPVGRDGHRTHSIAQQSITRAAARIFAQYLNAIPGRVRVGRSNGRPCTIDERP
jgi:hypothetical protein